MHEILIYFSISSKRVQPKTVFSNIVCNLTMLFIVGNLLVIGNLKLGNSGLSFGISSATVYRHLSMDN